MKAKEAPEKLYIWFNHPYTVDYTKLNERRYEEEVEYTRTDAFIEKAEAWLRKNQQGFILTDKDITDFINYMEGE